MNGIPHTIGNRFGIERLLQIAPLHRHGLGKSLRLIMADSHGNPASARSIRRVIAHFHYALITDGLVVLRDHIFLPCQQILLHIQIADGRHGIGILFRDELRGLIDDGLFSPTTL